MFEEGKVPAVITEFLVVKFREVAGSADECRLLSLKCSVEDRDECLGVEGNPRSPPALRTGKDWKHFGENMAS